MVLQRNCYTYSLLFAIILSVVGELFLFVYYGVIRYPDGPLLYKFLWAIVFCGIGMGSALGALTSLFIVDCLRGYRAVLATTLLSTVILGIACNLLCLNLDRHFHFFGSSESPLEFFLSGIILSALGGLLLGVILFTKIAGKYLVKIGLPVLTE